MEFFKFCSGMRIKLLHNKEVVDSELRGFHSILLQIKKKKKFMDLIGFEIFKIKQFNFYFDGKH